jgi:hypothetical protein
MHLEKIVHIPINFDAFGLEAAVSSIFSFEEIQVKVSHNSQVFMSASTVCGEILLLFIYTIGEPGVHAWDLAQRPDPGTLDLDRYAELLLRAAHTVLQPLGVKEETLRWWLYSNAGYGAPPGEMVEGQNGLPLFTSQTISRRW